ncbi:hypothetical protein [Pseudoalteromonas sp. CH_XMU1449-3]|uniref:hypothetical protein n=1 Tax=Pseudoalteromonas sp. CH_XMU1449-3 TaxID=3107774 RepID=UPI00300B738B
MGIAIYVIALVLMFLTFCGFFFSNFNFNPDTPIENWVNTASYFNGVLTPPLLAITSILIFLTWQTSKAELSQTRDSLKEQLNLQNFSTLQELISQLMNSLKELDLETISIHMVGNNITVHKSDKKNPIEGINYKGEKSNILKKYMSRESFFLEHFTHINKMKKENSSNLLEGVTYSKLFFDYREKLISLGLLLQLINSEKYKKIVITTYYPRVSMLSWIFYLEIIASLFDSKEIAKKNDLNTVFVEIANIVLNHAEGKLLLKGLSPRAWGLIIENNLIIMENSKSAP